MELTSKQRAQLRGLANTIDTIIHVGKDGIGENLIKQADDALRPGSSSRAVSLKTILSMMHALRHRNWRRLPAARLCR